MSTDEPRPGTTAAVEAKVERLSASVSQLEQRMTTLELGQKHQAEINGLQFKTVEAALQANTNQLTAFMTKIDADRALGIEAATDPTKTAAGRQIVGDIGEIKNDVFGLGVRVGNVERRVWMAIGAFAVVSLLVQIMGPAILRVLIP